jgi:hypothetical protein
MTASGFGAADRLALAGGTLTGPLVLDGSPPLEIPAGAASGKVLTSDSSGNAAWQAPAGGGSVIDGVTVGGTPSTGQVLTATGTSAADWQAVTATTIDGVTVTGTPSSGQVLTATSASAADWQGVTATTIDGVTVTGTPSTGQVLTAISGTAADWQTAPGAGGAMFFNVMAYGALGNGTADDTTFIQAAAAAMEANGGGCLYFPAATGDYKTTASITLSSYGDGVHVMGDGYCSRIKATGNYDTFVVNAGNGVAFSYLYLDSTVGRNATDTGCATTSGSNQVTDPQAATADAGSTITGPGIPGGTTISSVNTSTHTYTISANATATASGVAMTVTGSTAGAAVNMQTGGTVRINNVWMYNSFNGLECFNGGGRTEIVNSWIYGRNYGIYTQNPLHILSTGISGDSIGVVSDSCNGSLWMMGCDLNGICSLVTRNTLGIAEPNYGVTLINVGANYNGGGITPPEGTIGFDFTQCYGELRLYASYASGSSIRIGGRADTVTITSGSATFTDASAVSGDVGKNLYASGIPAGTTVSSVSGTTVTMSVNATGSGVRTVGVGGPITQDVEITGGDYGGDNSTPPHGIPQAILINSAKNVRINGSQIQGAATNTYPGILVNALTGPLTISGLQWTRPTLYCADISALPSTAGPVSISGCQFNGEFVTSPINYNASFQANYTFLGNDAGPQMINGSSVAVGGGIYDGQVSTYEALAADATGITSSALANVTALGVPVTSGDAYLIEFTFRYTASVSASTNIGWGLSNPSVTYGAMWSTIALSSGGSPKEYADAVTQTRSAQATDTSNGMTLHIRVLALFSASGTVYPQLSAGSAGTSTLTPKAGSFAVARRIA